MTDLRDKPLADLFEMVRRRICGDWEAPTFDDAKAALNEIAERQHDLLVTESDDGGPLTFCICSPHNVDSDCSALRRACRGDK